MRLIAHAAILAAAITFAFPAAAQTTSAKPVKAPPDPNKVICESEDVTGSRLATRRTCMTRAEWAERRRRDRETVERVQSQMCNTGNGCGGQ